MSDDEIRSEVEAICKKFGFGIISVDQAVTMVKTNQPKPATGEIEARIREYLSAGGLFNPEMMEHEKVRDLLMDCRDALAAEREKVETLTKALVEFENEYPHVTTLLREEYAKFHGDDYADMDAARKRILDLEDELHDEREAAKKLCEIYFNIAAETIGEDEVRRRRDAALVKVKEEK